MVGNINQQLPNGSHKLSCEITFHNFGKTPALISTMCVSWSKPMPSNSPPIPQRDPKALMALWMLGSDQSEPPTIESTELSVADYQLIKSETNSIWLVGWVEYKDVFDKPHVTGFTRRYDPNFNVMLPVTGDGFEVRS